MLNESEWNTVNNILLELYTVNDLDIFAQKSMKFIRMLIPYTKGWFIILNEDQEIVSEKSYFTGFVAESVDKYVNTYHEHDYIRFLYEFTSETGVFRDSNILDTSIRSDTDFYREFLVPENIIYGCGILIIRSQRVTGVFNLFRNEDSGDFTDKEIYVLNIFKKHMENMLFNVMKLSLGNRSITKNIKSFSEKYSLTSREEDVLTLINDGCSNQEIAEKLVVSLSTVKKHVYNLFNKTGASSRSQLINMVVS